MKTLVNILKMSKYYFDKYCPEACFTKQYWIDYMHDNDIKEMEIVPAKVERGTGYFFCQEYQELGETGTCGKTCDAYHPRNGKGGICKHYGYVYEIVDEVIKLTIT